MNRKLPKYKQDALDLLRVRLNPNHPGNRASDEVKLALGVLGPWLDTYVLPAVYALAGQNTDGTPVQKWVTDSLAQQVRQSRAWLESLDKPPRTNFAQPRPDLLALRDRLGTKGNGVIAHQYVDASDAPGMYEADHCSRQAVTVEWAHENLVDITVYHFSEDRGEFNGDPWLMIDGGIDRSTKSDPVEYFLCHGRSGELKVPGSALVFVPLAKLENVLTEMAVRYGR